MRTLIYAGDIVSHSETPFETFQVSGYQDSHEYDGKVLVIDKFGNTNSFEHSKLNVESRAPFRKRFND